MTDAETTERSDELVDDENGADSAPVATGDGCILAGVDATPGLKRATSVGSA